MVEELINDASVFVTLATKLMQISTLSTATECNWSHFGFIHSLHRNRLTNEHIFKLVSVYFNLHLISEINKQNINYEDNRNDIEIMDEDEVSDYDTSEYDGDKNNQESFGND